MNNDKFAEHDQIVGLASLLEQTFGLVEYMAIVKHDSISLCINNHRAVKEISLSSTLLR